MHKMLITQLIWYIHVTYSKILLLNITSLTKSHEIFEKKTKFYEKCQSYRFLKSHVNDVKIFEN